MKTVQNITINKVLDTLLADAKFDFLRMVKGAAKSVIGSFQPHNFKDAYLAISKEQGEGLVKLIKNENIKSIVEFGTSFGISTLYLAQGVLETKGSIITTELIASKAERAQVNFKNAGVEELIDLRIGDALDTLKSHNKPIDLLLLDGWKDLYLPLFTMLESNFHQKTIIYVDNADMAETKAFLNEVRKNENYKLESIHQGKAVLISVN